MGNNKSSMLYFRTQGLLAEDWAQMVIDHYKETYKIMETARGREWDSLEALAELKHIMRRVIISESNE